MNMVDIISCKRDKKTLTENQIQFLVDGVCNDSIPDYQISAFLMAVYFNGLSPTETALLTEKMALSGDTADLSQISGIKVDKHSTGGVGDKTTLIVAPIVAACGVPVAKMSGKGLGHTGGTVDKLESIPGFKTTIPSDMFVDIVKKVGLSIVGQSGNFAPADKKLYALRDVTATVESVPLIAASIMSKKIAAGSDAIVLDVKTGSGAFMHTIKDSIYLAKTMVDIGTRVGKKTIALITDMDRPLGYAIGNSIEVIEAIEVLNSRGSQDLTYVCIELATNMLVLGGVGDEQYCREIAEKSLENKTAFNAFRNMVIEQGGDVSVIDNPELFEKSKVQSKILAHNSGYIYSMDTELIGKSSVELGAGRHVKDQPIDYSAGIILLAKTGDYVNKGQPIATLLTENEKFIAAAQDLFLRAVIISDKKPEIRPYVYAKVSQDGVFPV